jgi:hypothetical protein
LAENYATKSITLVDFIDVRDIASGAPFYSRMDQGLKLLNINNLRRLHAAGMGRGVVHFIAVLRTIAGIPTELEGTRGYSHTLEK